MIRKVIGLAILAIIGSSILLVVGAFWAGGKRNPRVEIPPPAPGPIDFGLHVRPILAAHCFSCHGPERQRGALRLDRREDALRGGKSGEAIAPGRAIESRLFRLVVGLDEGRRMPPQEPRLDASQVGVLRAWIDGGAPWPVERPDG